MATPENGLLLLKPLKLSHLSVRLSALVSGCCLACSTSSTRSAMLGSWAAPVTLPCVSTESRFLSRSDTNAAALLQVVERKKSHD